MKQLLLFSILISYVTPSLGQNYAADLIPFELKSRASAIVRNETIEIDMKSDVNISQKVTRAITVLNQSGENHGSLSLFYNKGKSIKSISGFVYDEFGKQIKKFGMRDFSDYSATNQGTMYDDVRVKHYDSNVHTYPYTIVYTFEIKDNQNLFIPYWTPNRQADLAVQKSTYQFSCKPTEELRLKEQNILIPPIITKTDKASVYTWTANNLNARKPEPYSPVNFPNEIIVKIVPKSFQYFKKTGQVDSWNDLGKWLYNDLLKDKSDLSEATKEKAREIASKHTTDKEKAKALYEYMQSKTRYISIQVGIGGIEPFPASYVDKLGYGDCKALVNYTQALLDAANIKSYYCIVEAGDIKIDLDRDFANVVDGNHIILCIPLASDTTWLECTNNKAPFGYLGDFTDDRLVLACTPEGGKVLRTPKYTHQKSIQARSGKLTIDPSGSISGSIQTIFSGAQFDNHFSHTWLNQSELNKSLKEAYDVDNIVFENVSYKTNHTDNNFTLVENIDVNIKNYVVKNGRNIIVQPNVFNALRSIPESRNRTNDLYINRGYTDIDELEFILSEKIDGIVLPVSKKLECPMGTYEFKVTASSDKIKLYRKIEIYDGTYSPENYEKYFLFRREVASMDRGKYTLQLTQKQ